jgi:hypothetical protein
MSMHPQPIPAIPEETVCIAHAVLPEGNVWMQMRDELGTLYEDQDFQDLFKALNERSCYKPQSSRFYSPSCCPGTFSGTSFRASFRLSLVLLEYMSNN